MNGNTQQQHLNTFTSSNLFYFFQIKETGEIINVNNYARQYFSSKNNNIKNIININEQRKFIHVIHAALAKPLKHFQLVLNCTDYQGREIWIKWEISCIHTELNQKELFLIGYTLDNKSATEKLYKSYSRKVFSILNSITDGFFMLNGHNFITQTNKAFKTLLQIKDKDSSDVIGCDLVQLLPQIDLTSLYENISNVKKNKQKKQIELFIPLLKKWFEFRIYPYGQEVAIYLTDITQRKNQLEELIQKNHQLQEISQLQSHELRHGIVNIQSLVYLLQTDSLSPEQKEIVQMIKESAEKVDNIIHLISKLIHQ